MRKYFSVRTITVTVPTNDMLLGCFVLRFRLRFGICARNECREWLRAKCGKSFPYGTTVRSLNIGVTELVMRGRKLVNITGRGLRYDERRFQCTSYGIMGTRSIPAASEHARIVSGCDQRSAMNWASLSEPIPRTWQDDSFDETAGHNECDLSIG